MKSKVIFAIKLLIVLLVAAVFGLAYFGFMSVTGFSEPRLWFFYPVACVFIGLYIGMSAVSSMDIDF